MIQTESVFTETRALISTSYQEKRFRVALEVENKRQDGLHLEWTSTRQLELVLPTPQKEKRDSKKSLSLNSVMPDRSFPYTHTKLEAKK